MKLAITASRLMASISKVSFMMTNCAWCGKQGAEIGFGLYYDIDSPYIDKHDLLMWCCTACYHKANGALTKHPRSQKLHTHYESELCLGEFHQKDFPLCKLKNR